jgi:hypothetical protein
MKYYVTSVITNSTGTDTRNFNVYENYETALRKFYEAFNTIGAGSKKIVASLSDEYLNVTKHDIWVQETEEPTE